MSVSAWRDGRAARALFWAVALFSFVMAVIPHPPEVPGHPNDKVEHMAAFATLAAIGSLAYARAGLLRLLIGLSLFGAFIEVVQAIPALQRDSDVWDWVADTVAVVAILTLVWLWRRLTRA